MRFLAPVTICLLGLAAVPARADVPLYLFDKLPVPLKLPPGNVQTLPVNHDGSFFGDQLRAVDCGPNVKPAFPGNRWEMKSASASAATSSSAE